MSEKMKHPLADVFDLAPVAQDESLDLSPEAVDESYDMVPQGQVQPPAIVDDEEDKEIGKKIDEIYDVAMAAYNNQTAYVEILEPRYAARNAEVAANYLNTALNAVSLKAKVKNEKKKINAGFVPFKNNGGTNIVVADRNQILQMMDNNQRTIEVNDK
jgi:hypothetical protein